VDLLEEAEFVIPRAQEAMQNIGQITGVVNAAATTARGNLETTTAVEFDAQMAINVRAPFLITQGAARVMPPGSSIVNICSVAAHGGAPFVMAYSVSKAALVTLTRNNAAELAPRQIRVNAVNMGWTFTDNEDKIQLQEHSAGKNWVQEADASVPLGRILRPTDVATTVCFLLSDASRMMTGSIVDLHPEYAHGMLSCSGTPGEGR
jgi:NAD(P)-dependent dehydrogenase (short-subunit alcohol dehydrogenase family)